MNTKQSKTLAQIFERPTRSDIEWKSVMSLLIALGAEVEERSGSRVAVRLHERIALLHRPHPERVIGKGMTDRIRSFLSNAGVTP